MTNASRKSRNRQSRRSRRARWFRRRVVESSSQDSSSLFSPPSSPLALAQRLFGRTPQPSPPKAPAETGPNPFKQLAPEPAKLVFDCQLAHGSPTIRITNVNSLPNMYKAIAAQYPNVNAEDILFCTVNTHKPDMNKLLSSNLALDDFIFAHLKGQKKEVTFTKKTGVLGLTVTDNCNGVTFIKRIQADSVCATVHPAIDVGDHIEKINGESMVGKRHFQVARMLRGLPVGSTITLRLISPIQNGFSFLSKRPEVRPRASNDIENGSQTIRFFANGHTAVQEAPDKALLERINRVFEEYLGVNDDDLALSIWELGRDCTDLMDMEEKLRASPDLSAFNFPDELVFDMWGIVDDHKNRRLAQGKAETEAVQGLVQVVGNNMQEKVGVENGENKAKEQCYPRFIDDLD